MKEEKTMKKFASKLLASLLAITAAASAVALPAAAADGSWKKDGTGWWYSYSAGGYAKNGWSKIDGVWYYFTPSGYMKTGWLQDGGKWYYLTGSGAMKTGWLQLDDTWYFMDGSGAMKTGWVFSGGKWYYMDSLGKMKSDTLLTLDDGTYYLDKSGAMFTGEMTYNGQKLTFNAKGRLAEGTETDPKTDPETGPEKEPEDPPEEGAKPPLVTFGTPTGWFTSTPSDGFYLLMREDYAASLDGSNIMVLSSSLDGLTAEQKALLGNPEAYAMDKDTLAQVKASLEENSSIAFKDVAVTGAVNKTTKGKSAATFTISATITQTGVDIPYQISQTHILFEDALVVVQLTSTEVLFPTYEGDLNKILAGINLA